MQKQAGPLIFVHVPRSGGTTVWEVFRTAMPGKVRRLALGSERKNERELNELLERPPGTIALIGGHVRQSAVPPGVPRERMMSFLRRPRGRIISSWFSRIRKGKIASAHDDSRALLEYAEAMRFRALMLLTDVSRRDLARWSKAPDIEAHARKLAAMIDERFGFIGFLERFDTSLCALSSQLGWRRVPYYEERNRTRDKSDLGEETLAEIDRLVRLEDLVYEALFEQRSRAWRRDFPFLPLKVLLYRIRCRLKEARRSMTKRAQ